MSEHDELIAEIRHQYRWFRFLCRFGWHRFRWWHYIGQRCVRCGADKP